MHGYCTSLSPSVGSREESNILQSYTYANTIVICDPWTHYVMLRPAHSLHIIVINCIVFVVQSG